MSDLAAPLSPGLRPAGFRTLPHNVEVERALLGAIFLDNRRGFEAVSEFLRPEHFALLEHGRIYEACETLIERGQTAHPATLKPYFDQNGGLEDIGGVEALVEIADSAITVYNAAEFGKIIYDLHLRRELIALGERISEEAYDTPLDDAAAHQIERAEAALYELGTKGELEGGLKPFKIAVGGAVSMAEATRKRADDLVGITTGFIDLDRILGGLHPSDLIIVAGRPGMGKTAFATNIATNASYAHYSSDGARGALVGFFSLEMSSEQLAARIVCEQLEIPSDSMRKGQLSNEEFVRLVQGTNELQRLPIFIDDTPALTITALRSRARRLKRQHGLGLIVVDYLQLVAGAPGARSENRVQELSAITRGLKTIAKELDVPLIAISQLSRAVEQREDKRPQLSDLRESGSIEQDADVVMFLYREEYYRRHKDGQNQTEVAAADDPDRNVAIVDIAKHRHGATEDKKLRFFAEYTRFANYHPATHEGP